MAPGNPEAGNDTVAAPKVETNVKIPLRNDTPGALQGDLTNVADTYMKGANDMLAAKRPQVDAFAKNPPALKACPSGRFSRASFCP